MRSFRISDRVRRGACLPGRGQFSRIDGVAHRARSDGRYRVRVLSRGGRRRSGRGEDGRKHSCLFDISSSTGAVVAVTLTLTVVEELRTVAP